MELVYLWVEDYKNIHHQGFNFSPRFTCKYDEDTKKLTIDEKKDYINIFPENINVTAIVGENGSGKSSLLKLLHKGLLVWKGKGFAIFINEKNEKFYLCQEEDYPFLAEKCKPLYSEDRMINFPFFEYSFTYDRDLDYSNEFIYPKKQINSRKGVIDLTKELFRNQKNILLNYFGLKTKKQLDKFEAFFIPKTINIFFDTSTIKSNNRFPKLIGTSDSELKNLKNSIINNKTTDDFINIIKQVSDLLTNPNSYEPLPNQFDYFNPQSEFQLGLSDTQEEEYTNLWHTSFQSSHNSINLTTLSEIKTIQSIRTNEEWLDESDLHIYSFNIEKLDFRAIEVIMTSFSSYQFTVQLLDANNKALNDLSFGEQQLIFILNQLYSLKNNWIQVLENVVHEGKEHEIETDKEILSYIVLLDEIDIGWHPMWQKKSISYICDFLKLIPNINFHLVFATHSPFILSDLPKENVIFLKNGKQDKTVNIDTFGANIHTLLSHGFFMKDGLMGEFAKEKIQSIINYHQKILKKELTKEENKKLRDKEKENYEKEHQATFRQIQSIIGDNYLKQVVKNHLVEIEKIVLGNDEAKQNEIDRLQAQIDLLKSNDA